jgi:CysZ protein
MPEPALSSMGVLHRFLAGFSYCFHGFRHLWQRPRLWIWAAIPIALMVGLVIGSFLLTFSAVPWLMAHLWAWPGGPGLGRALGRTVWIVVAAVLAFAVFAASVVIFWALSSLFATPFYDMLAEKVEQELLGIEQPPTPWIAIFSDAGQSVSHTLLALVLYGLAVGFVALVELMPGIGTVLGTLLGVVVTAMFLASEVLDTPLARRRVSFATKIRFQARHFALFQGFGTAAMVLLAVPGVNFLSMPVAVVGGTLLYCRLEREGEGVLSG